MGEVTPAQEARCVSLIHGSRDGLEEISHQGFDTVKSTELYGLGGIAVVNNPRAGRRKDDEASSSYNLIQGCR